MATETLKGEYIRKPKVENKNYDFEEIKNRHLMKSNFVSYDSETDTTTMTKGFEECPAVLYDDSDNKVLYFPIGPDGENMMIVMDGASFQGLSYDNSNGGDVWMYGTQVRNDDENSELGFTFTAYQYDTEINSLNRLSASNSGFTITRDSNLDTVKVFVVGSEYPGSISIFDENDASVSGVLARIDVEKHPLIENQMLHSICITFNQNLIHELPNMIRLMFNFMIS